MEVISGTFNAEYGQAMSGVVNIVTEDGSHEFHGTLSANTGDYVTSHTSLFPNIGKLDKLTTKDYEFSLSGPTAILDNLTFFTTGRYFYDPGYLYGQRIFKVTDNPLNGPKDLSSNLIITNSGDGSYVAMSPSERYTFNGKLTYSLPSLKLSYGGFWNKTWNKYFSQ
jgi:hypothetical protein